MDCTIEQLHSNTSTLYTEKQGNLPNATIDFLNVLFIIIVFCLFKS
jgi:hypothetical protein